MHCSHAFVHKLAARVGVNYKLAITNWQLQIGNYNYGYQLQAKHNFQLQLQLHSYCSSTITITITRHLVAMRVKDSTSHVVIPGGNCKIE